VVSELVKVITCDVCGTSGAGVREYPAMRVLSLEPRAIDLCDGCLEPLEIAEAYLEEHGRLGRRPSSARPADVRRTGELMVTFRTCPECRHVAPTRSATSTHVRARHGLALGALEDKRAVTYRCPDCSVSGSFASVSAHARHTGHSLLEVAR
jgi:hypothetical protein